MAKDLEVIQKAVNGDNDAFLELMNRYKIDLYKTALSYLRNENDALEAIQEVTFRAYSKLHSLREPAYFKTWLIRIMINYCNDQLHIRKQTVFDSESLLENIPRKDSSELKIELEDAMDKLNNRSREILMLKYFHDLKIKDIAFVLQKPVGTIKTWLNRALAELKYTLDEKGGPSNVQEGGGKISKI